MAPISPDLRKRANRVAVTAPDLPKPAHFHACPTCGQQVDRRRLGDIIYHESLQHEPLGA
jgi:hypothetical protein